VLATQIAVADGHWSRLLGLLPVAARDFSRARALWIVPCRGVHTLGMRFPIDVVYLDKDGIVLYAEAHLKPWRVAPVRVKTVGVLELPAGTLAESGTIVGDTIEIKLQKERR